MNDKKIRLKPVKQIMSIVTVPRPILSSESLKRLKKMSVEIETRRSDEGEKSLLQSVGETLFEGREIAYGKIEDVPMEFLRALALWRILPFIAGNKPLLKWLHDAPSDDVDEMIKKVQRSAVGKGNTSISVFAQLKALADEIAVSAGVPVIKKKRKRSTMLSTITGYKILMETGDEDAAIEAMMPLKKLTAPQQKKMWSNAKKRLRRYRRENNEP